MAGRCRRSCASELLSREPRLRGEASGRWQAMPAFAPRVRLPHERCVTRGGPALGAKLLKLHLNTPVPEPGAIDSAVQGRAKQRRQLVRNTPAGDQVRIAPQQPATPREDA